MIFANLARLPHDSSLPMDQAALVLVQGLHLEDILQRMYSTETDLAGDALFCR